MTEGTVVVRNYPGIHAHPAGLFVKRASEFTAEIFVRHGDLNVNGKSILGVLMLAAETGAQLTITADGPDEADAVRALVELVESRFGEDAR
ncbi:MAG: HPr family phosphocarrier protein [Candidatus Eisenbacteria bacterium]